jgi:Fur family ferric uptake transcriptional regulator
LLQQSACNDSSVVVISILRRTSHLAIVVKRSNGVVSHHTGLVESVRGQGYRMTPQREMILDAIHREGHVTADEIYQRVCAKTPAINLATVYRTLELLKALGIVNAIDTGEGCVHYELPKQPHRRLVRGGYTLELDCDVLRPLERSYQAIRVRPDNHLALFEPVPIVKSQAKAKEDSHRRVPC